MAVTRTIRYAGRRLQVLAAASLLALACVLALGMTLATAGPAQADEVDPSMGKDSFALNLAMDVSDIDDPAHPVHPIMLAVTNQHGEAVADARVSYAFDSVAEEAGVATLSDDEGAVAPVDVPAPATAVGGTAVTGPNGTVALAGVARGCGYALVIEADGHERYEHVHVCRGTDAERWEVVLTKTGGGSGGSGGSGSGPGGSGGSGAGNAGGSSGSDNEVESPFKPLPRPGSSSGSGILFRIGGLAVTGDQLIPIAFGLAGLALAAVGVVALARRRAEEGSDVH